MVTSLLLEVSKSNYEPDTDLLSNAKTSDIPLSGKIWLVHSSGHKMWISYKSFEHVFPALIHSCFTIRSLSTHLRSRPPQVRGKPRALTLHGWGSAMLLWHWFLDIISWRIWSSCKSLTYAKHFSTLTQPVEMAEKCPFFFFFSSCHPKKIIKYIKNLKSQKIVWIQMRKNWISFTFFWKLNKIKYELWKYFLWRIK